jgi:hypothetical protein
MDHDQGRHEGMVSDGGRYGGMVGDGGRLKPELSATGRDIFRWGHLTGDGAINRVVGFSQVEIFLQLSPLQNVHMQSWSV